MAVIIWAVLFFIQMDGFVQVQMSNGKIMAVELIPVLPVFCIMECLCFMMIGKQTNKTSTWMI